ncbi:MAG TPA: hypothetical protein VE911_06060 [Candidatus Nitrosopolaris sp.]|nr:hypothetical protein [Candidatus Nitrosopolaris sp.]
MRPAVVLVLALAAGALASDDGRMEVAGLRFAVPSGWERVQPTSPMRAAQFRIPRAGRKQEDGELLLFGYSPRKGGSASDLAERWYAQFTQPDGKSSKEAASVTRRSVNGLTVEVIDLAGTYHPAMGPMEHTEKPNWRLLGAVVEDDDRGPWYWRAVGPAETMEKAKAGFDALIGTLEVQR